RIGAYKDFRVPSSKIVGKSQLLPKKKCDYSASIHKLHTIFLKLSVGKLLVLTGYSLKHGMFNTLAPTREKENLARVLNETKSVRRLYDFIDYNVVLANIVQLGKETSHSAKSNYGHIF
ncbi:hypothetical protein PanWU01x14_026190, partial [Parasponia andersonii]